jgi:hypothetical protein
MLTHVGLKKTEVNLAGQTYGASVVGAGSESGAVVIPGKPQESHLYKMVREGLMSLAERAT